MFCTKCGTEHHGKFCPECGNPAIPPQQPVKPQQQYVTVNQPVVKTKRNGCLTAFLVVASIIVFISIIIPLMNGFFKAMEADTTTKADLADNGNTTNQLSESEIRQNYINSCELVNYRDLIRNPQNYVGKKLAVTGQISQYMAGGTFYEEGFSLYEDYDFSKQDTYLEKRWYIEYKQPQTNRILEDDVVTFYGEFTEMAELTLVLGRKEMYPELIAKYHVIHFIDEETTGVS